MAASGKKQKKLKGKTVELSVFLADDQRGLPGGPGSSIVRPRPTFNSWADEVESQDPDGDYPEVPYKSVIDRSMLPTAPRAARGPDIDLETVPKQPPFVAYIGNLPYDTEQDKIYKFFNKLKVTNIRLPTEKGKLRGFGYVDFEDRESLIEALSMNDDMIQGRKIRIALSGNMDREDRRGGADDQIDRTDCDWRRGGGGGGGGGGERSNDGFGDRDGGRYGDRDRDRGGFGSAAPESGRWERMGGPSQHEKSERYEAAPSDDNQMWDRGYTVDSSKGDRWGDRNDRWNDRRGGDERWGDRNERWNERRGGDDRWNDRNDRWNDRRGGDDRWGDRNERWSDRGYGDRDRGYGGGRYRDDDRGYGGRKNYGSERNYERRGGGGGGGGGGSYSGDRAFNSSRDSSREPPKDRPKLNLQPRTKPVETVPEKTSSIFGGARPVDTSQREKEIEERLRKQEDMLKTRDEEKENLGSGSNKRLESLGNFDRPYRAEGDKESSRRERRLSSNSSQSKGIKPAPLNQSRTRRDSNNSNTSEVYSDEKEEKPAPPSPRKEDAPAKMVPAPPPKENIWERRKTEQKSGKDNSYNEDKNYYESSNKWKKNQIDSNRENDRRSISTDDEHKRAGKPANEKGRNPREKQMPKSYEEMPQYQDTVKKDWTDANKFNYLNNEDDEDYQENLS